MRVKAKRRRHKMVPMRRNLRNQVTEKQKLLTLLLKLMMMRFHKQTLTILLKQTLKMSSSVRLQKPRRPLATPKRGLKMRPPLRKRRRTMLRI